MIAFASAASFIATLGPYAPVQAQTAPGNSARQSVKVLVGFPPGAGTDSAARIYADQLRDALGTTVVVENRPGAGGQIAAQLLKGAPADGSTVMVAVDHQIVMLPHIMKDPGFDPYKDFAPIARMATYNLCLAVHSSVPAKDVESFAALVRKDPSKGNFGMPAPGSNAHFMGFVIARHLQATLNPVPYRGAAPALADLVAGQLPAAIMPCDAMAEHHKAGRVRIIGSASEKRLAWLPDTRTLQESGIKVPTDYFVGVYAPAGTPKPVLEKLREVSRTMLTPEAVSKRIAATGMTPAYGSADDLDRIGHESSVFWGEQMRLAGFQPN